jgi:hypothetical protein
MKKIILLTLLLSGLDTSLLGQSIPKVMCRFNDKQVTVEKLTTGRFDLLLEDVVKGEVLMRVNMNIQDDTCICTDTSVTWLDVHAWHTKVCQIQYKNGTWKNFASIGNLPTIFTTKSSVQPGDPLEEYVFKLTSIETIEAELTVKYLPLQGREFPIEKYHVTYKLDFREKKFWIDKKIRLE